MENEEVIRQQMEETRTSLTEKLETLEEKLVSTVQETTSAVQETVSTVKETVHEGVEAVHETVATVREGVNESVETVKDFFDVKTQVSQHPWLMVGGSVAVGFTLGMLTNRASAMMPAPSYGGNGNGHAWNGNGIGYKAATTNGNGHGWAQQAAPMPAASAPAPAAPAAPATSSTSASASTVVSSLLSMFGPELDRLKGLALGAALGTVREMLASSVPSHLGDQLRNIVDDVTKKVGGQPLPSEDWAGCPLAEKADAHAHHG